MIKNVIFDLGGVVLGRDFNQFADRGDIANFFGFLRTDNFPDCWKAFDRGTLTQSQTAAELALINGWSIEEAERNIATILSLMVESPRTVELIRRLRQSGQYKLYVLSNMPLEYYEHIRQFEVFGLFDGVVISSLEHLCKPEAEFFELLLQRYGLQPQECMFVDDKLVNIEAAERLGLCGYHFTDKEHSADRIASLLLK